MKQQAAQHIRVASVEEVVARAYHRLLKRQEGKTSRRVSVPLPANILPPLGGEYKTAFGIIRIKPTFLHEKGRWVVEVRFPPSEGFTIADHVKQHLTPEETRELNEIVERLWAK